MNQDLKEEIRKTNNEFIELLKSLPNRRIQQQIKKQVRKQRKIGEKKAYSSIKELFNENKQLKRELKDKKLSDKRQKQELTELRKQKNEVSSRLRNEIKNNKYKNKEIKKQLKVEKKQLQMKIKQHPVFIKNREKAKAFNMFKSLKFEIIPLEKAYNGTVGKYACRKKVKKNQDYKIKCESGLQIETILDQTIEAREILYSDLLKKEKGLKIKEEIQCVFKYYNQELEEYIYITVKLGSGKTSYTFINTSDIHNKLKHSSEIFCNLVDEYNQHGSGSVIFAFTQLIIHKASYTPLSGKSYIKLPPYLENKKALINC